MQSHLSAFDQVEQSVRWLRPQLGGRPHPQVGIVLGSGLGPLAQAIELSTVFPYAAIPHFPKSTAPGHAGELYFGNIGKVSVVAMKGRHHLYEGNTPNQCVHGVRTMIHLGAKIIIVTNAAGGISTEVRPSDLQILKGHINKTGQSPLRGPHDPRLGTRFQPMNQAYDVELQKLAMTAWESLEPSVQHGLRLHQSGVYAMMPGPEYETAEEIAMLERDGANLVGMSTVFEVIAAVNMGARVLGISCITNLAAGIQGSVPSEGEVLDAAAHASPTFVPFVSKIIQLLPPIVGA